VISPRREHSRKPDDCRESIQRLVAGPYCELFAREEHPGWDVWGNQVGKFAEAAFIGKEEGKGHMVKRSGN
jgi:N6-adenosine-specific RNA methylase IME4